MQRLDDLIEIELFTAEKDGKGEFLGLYKLNVGEIVGQGEVETWYTLQKKTKKSKVSGKIHLRLFYTSVEKQDVYIDIQEVAEMRMKTQVYVKLKLGAGKAKTSVKSVEGAPESPASVEWSGEQPIQLPFDETEQAIKFWLIDATNRRAKLGVAQILLSDIKMDEITDLTAIFVSTKKKEQQIAEMRLRISIGDDIEAMERAAAVSAEAELELSTSKRRKKEKREKKERKKREGEEKKRRKKGGAKCDEDSSMGSEWTNSGESETDASETSMGESDGGSSESEGGRRRSKSFSSSKNQRESTFSTSGTSPRAGVQQTKDNLWPDQEDEDSYMSRMPSNFKPAGKVLIEVREARNLVGSGGGRKDVVFVAKCDYQVFTSQCIKATQNPIWNEMLAFRVHSTTSKITIGLRDEKEVNPTMGMVTLDIFQFEQESISEWFHLRTASSHSDPVSGDIFITATWVPFSDNPYARNASRSLGIPESPRGMDISPRGGSSSSPLGSLTVHVLQAQDLNGKEGQLISSVKVSMEDGSDSISERTTPPAKGTVNPVWTVSNQFTFPVHRVKNAELRFTVQDNLRATEAPAFLGFGSLALEQLARAEERTIDRWFTLQRKARRAKVTGKVRLKVKMELQRLKGDASLFSSDDLVDDNLKYDSLFKVILIGESGVGKTGLFNRFTSNQFSPGTKATIGSEITCKSFRAERKIIKVQMWDTAGQERFRSLTRQYYRGSMGAILVYDITNKASFDKLHSWIDDVIQFSNNPNLQLLLVGNKVQKKRKKEKKSVTFNILYYF